MNRIGLDPYTVDVMFLGDAYFEYEMLKQSILEAGLYQNTYSDSTEIADKITAMYNALDEEKVEELGLTFGVALTEEQRSSLTTDIIWYVKQTVDLGNGETYEVLVPQIFYCDATLKQIEENRISNTVYSMIAGDSVTLTNEHSEGIINNSGIIAAKNNLIITGFDTINNITSSIDRNSTTTNTNGVATLSAGSLLYIDTTSTDADGNETTGTVNNLSGTISVGTADSTSSLLYINTGTLNNSTITQQETVEASGKQFEFKKISTEIGNIATIQGLGTDSDIVLKADEDINILGGDVKATGTDSDVSLTAGNDITIATVQDYEYERQYTNRDGGTFGETLKMESIDASLTNISSNLTAGGSLTLNSGNDITSIGTNFTATSGDINMTADNDIRIANAMDYTYSYDYVKREKFDVIGAAVAIAGTVAGTMATGGTNLVATGASAYAGITNASNMTKGSVDVSMKYDESTVNSTLTAGNNINIKSGADTTIVSSEITAANDLTLSVGDELYVGTAEEKHMSVENHEKFGTDYIGAFTSNMAGAAMTSMMVTAGGYIGGSIAGGAGAIVGTTAGAVAGANTQMAMSDFASKKIDGTKESDTIVLQSGSTLLSAGNMNITTENNLNVQGSDLISGGDVDLVSNNGNVNIVSAEETEQITSEKYSRGFDGIKFFDSSYGDKVKSGVNVVGTTINVNSEETITDIVTQKSSNLVANGSVVISAGKNLTNADNTDITDKGIINILASNISSETADIDLYAKNGVNILSKENTITTTTTIKDTTATLSASVGNNFLSVADEAAKTEDAYTADNADSGVGYTNSFLQTGNLAISVYNAAASVATLGFTAKVNLDMSTSKTDSTTSVVYNTASSLDSNSGSINILSDNEDITVKGSSVTAENDIDMTANNGSINISASQDTVNSNSETNTYGASETYDILTGAWSIPSFTYSNSESKYSSVQNNNTQITSNSGTVDITSKTDDINITGANISAQDNINLSAENGNVDIESTQDSLFSNNKYNSYTVGGTIGFGVGKDKVDIVTNNYTTLETTGTDENGNSTGSVNIATNDLNLVGIQDTTKDNMDLSLVRGNITETQLQEKNESDQYDLSITYNLPITINTGMGLLSTNQIQAETQSQSIIQTGDWIGSFMNTTVKYSDDNGYDFTASPASVVAATQTVISVIDVGYNIVRGLTRVDYYGNRAFSDQTTDEKAHEKAAEAFGDYVDNPVSGGILRTAGETGQFFYYSAKDIYSLITTGKHGEYQPYKFSSENGGLIDSYNDIMNVINGANGNYSNSTFPNGQTDVNKYNTTDYQTYINNGRKWN